MKLPRLPRLLRRGPRPPRRHLRVGLWGARLAMIVLFASLTLALTAALVYAVNLTLLPTNPDAIHAVARNRCIERFRPETEAWEACLREEPTPPSHDARPFVLGASWTAAAGLLLTVAAARARLMTLLTAIVLAGILAIGTAEAVRSVDRERERIARLRATPTVAPEAE